MHQKKLTINSTENADDGLTNCTYCADENRNYVRQINVVSITNLPVVFFRLTNSKL